MREELIVLEDQSDTASMRWQIGDIQTADPNGARGRDDSCNDA
jgi:hypothetical protein